MSSVWYTPLQYHFKSYMYITINRLLSIEIMIVKPRPDHGLPLFSIDKGI